MRIKVITLNFNTETGGGSHLTLELLLNYLSQKTHDVTLIASEVIKNKEQTVYKIVGEKIQGKFLETLDQVKNLLKKYEKDTDLFLLYGASLIFAGGAYKKEGGKVPITVYINSYIPSLGITNPDLQNLHLHKKIILSVKNKIHRWKHYFWDKFYGLRLVRVVDLIMFDSPSIKNIYVKFGFPENKTAIFPELIDIEKIQKIPTTTLQDYVIKKDAVNFLYVGRLLYDKGVDILIKAVSLLKSKEKCFVHIVGRGPQKEYLEKEILKYKLENFVKIYPWQTQKDLISFYKNTDVFIHPGRWSEPFGRTIIEFMSLGKPVITSDIGGTIFAMGDGGVTFKKGSTEDLSMVMQKFIDDKEFLNSFKIKALKQTELFDYKIIAPQIESKLIELIKK